MQSPPDFSLFREIPAAFFRPLAGRLAPVYWAVLYRLYQLDFEGEPFEITQELAVEQAAQLLEQNPEFLEDPRSFWQEIEAEAEIAGSSQGNTSPASPEVPAPDDERQARQLARQLLRRLERCGWFDYEYRQLRKGYVLNFRDYAARILHTLTQVAQREQPIFEGLAYGVKAALSEQALTEKPGAAAYNAQKATKDLVREIKILSRNMHRYADQALKQARTPKELLELQLDIYQKKVVETSYHRFKTSDNVFRYRAFILAQLDALRSDAMLHASAVQWISKSQSIAYSEANARFDDWLQLIQNQMSSMHLLTEDLDRKNARYTTATLQRIGYLLNQDHLLEGRLVRAITQTAAVPDDLSWAIDAPFAAFRVQTADGQSLYRPPKENAPAEPVALPESVVSDDRRRAALEKARAKISGQFTRKRVHELARSALEGRGKVRASDLPLSTREELTHLVFMTHHGRDRRSPFQFSLEEGWRGRLFRKGPFRARNGDFEWREKRQEHGQ